MQTDGNDMAAARAVLDNIASRRSVRSYSDRKVPEEMIEALLRAAMSAPSAKDRRPWSFIVVDDRETLDALASGLRYAKMLYGAPLAIAVCADTVTVRPDGTQVENVFWAQDASAATENLLLAAEALGLGAVWTAASDAERSAVVRRILGIPDGVMPLCVVPVGFPAGDERPKDKWDPSRIHRNRF